jgi:hypothetical protein
VTYSEVDDLLLGDITLGTGARADKYVQDATDEIDSCLGFRYELPLNLDYIGDPDNAVPSYAQLVLKQCANKLASGRLIMALAAGGEDTSMHAYGWALVQEGMITLNGLCSGMIDLPNAVPVNPVAVGRDVGPSLGNQDSSSAMDAFYQYVSDPTVTSITWAPGTMPL